MNRSAALGYLSYDDYLRGREWKAAKIRFRASGEPQACFCGEMRVDLHHKTYVRLGGERPSDLLALCQEHHSLLHQLVDEGQMPLSGDGLFSPERALTYSRPAGARNEVEEARQRRAATVRAVELQRQRAKKLGDEALQGRIETFSQRFGFRH